MDYLILIAKIILKIFQNKQQPQQLQPQSGTYNLKPYIPTCVINQEGFNLITSFEGCKLTTYFDQRGILTIGYGHTGPDVKLGQSITQNMAYILLKKDLDTFESGVSRLVSAKLTGNQFSALVCFSYNLGLGSLKNSTLLKKLNMLDYQGASEEFLAWDKINGQVSAGLLRRRQAEQSLFLTAGDGTVLRWA